MTKLQQQLDEIQNNRPTVWYVEYSLLGGVGRTNNYSGGPYRCREHAEQYMEQLLADDHRHRILEIHVVPRRG